MPQKLSEKALKHKYEYTAFHTKNNYKRFSFNVRNDETELLEWLESIPNKQQYFIDLVKKDMLGNK